MCYTQAGCGGGWGGGRGIKLAVAQNNFRIYLELFSRLGKSSEPVRNLFQNSEKFPNIFKEISKHLEKVPNLLGIFFQKSEKFPNILKFFPNSLKMLTNYLDKKCLET